MKNSLITIVAIMGIFFVFGCEKEEKLYIPIVRCADFTRNMDTINKYIHGTWRWLEEKKYDRYKGEFIYNTPNTPGWHDITLKFSGDSVRVSGYGSMDSIFQFRIQRMFEITNYPTDSLASLVYYSFFTGQRLSFVPVVICKNQLLMQHQIMRDDMGEYVWKRQ